MSERTHTVPETARCSRRDLLRAAAALSLVGAPAVVACRATSPGAGRDGPADAGDSLEVRQARLSEPLVRAPQLATVVTGMSAFTGALHRVTATSDTNWVVSPLSLSVAFGMLRAGARGRTGRQIDTVFGFPRGTAPAGSPHPALNALTADLVTGDPAAGPGPGTSPIASPTVSAVDGAGPPPVVAVANGLFVEKSFSTRVAPEFLRLLAGQYGAHATAVEFLGGHAVRVVNSWADRATRGRITKVFDSLDPGTLCVLANAVYLKATWQTQFPVAATVSGPFRTADGQTVQARLMRATLDGVAYTESADWQCVALPYWGDELTMRVVLPRRVLRDATALGALLPVATRRAPVAAGRFPNGWVDLTMPRWDTGTTVDLGAVLPRLGMPDAFDGAADLSGIAPGLSVTQAVHRANVTVDELGTEAGAVTGIAGAVAARAGAPVPVRVDRPFVWAVVHEPTGTPVFAGHVVDPTAQR